MRIENSFNQQKSQQCIIAPTPLLSYARVPKHKPRQRYAQQHNRTKCRRHMVREIIVVEIIGNLRAVIDNRGPEQKFQ